MHKDFVSDPADLHAFSQDGLVNIARFLNIRDRLAFASTSRQLLYKLDNDAVWPPDHSFNQQFGHLIYSPRLRYIQVSMLKGGVMMRPPNGHFILGWGSPGTHARECRRYTTVECEEIPIKTGKEYFDTSSNEKALYKSKGRVCGTTGLDVRWRVYLCGPTMRKTFIAQQGVAAKEAFVVYKDGRYYGPTTYPMKAIEALADMTPSQASSMLVWAGISHNHRCIFRKGIVLSQWCPWRTPNITICGVEDLVRAPSIACYDLSNVTESGVIPLCNTLICIFKDGLANEYGDFIRTAYDKLKPFRERVFRVAATSACVDNVLKVFEVL